MYNVNIRCEDLFSSSFFFGIFGFFGFLREQIPWDLNLTSNSNFNQIVLCRLTRRLAESLALGVFGGGDGRGADPDQRPQDQAQGQGQAGAALHCIALQCRALLEVSLGIKLRRGILLFREGSTGGPPGPQGSFPGPWGAFLSPWYRQYH